MNNSRKLSGLPREVWVAAISLKGLWPEKTIEKRMNDIIDRMENVYPFEPDIICLPETVNISWVTEMKRLEELAEDEHTPGPVTSRLAEIAKKRNCYITSPIITKKDGRYYNSCILINRKGEIAGTYHKIHPTDTEIIPEVYYKGGGMTPGTLHPPVFITDFGTVGIQICMDANWDDGWRSIKKDGAEVVLFLSQASYANIINNHAWLNHYNIVSSTGEDARIIDITGDVVASDGEFERWVCAPLNLEKKLVEYIPNSDRLKSLQKKYRREVRIKIYHAENWATVESNAEDIKVNDVLNEFDIPTFDEMMRKTAVLQDKSRDRI